MKKLVVRRPSASMVVAIVALAVAVSGTAVAASQLVSGDKLIKPGSLSGNRLRHQTLTGAQIKLSELGVVPSARRADSATHATSAATATNAGDLGGVPASGYLRASHVLSGSANVNDPASTGQRLFLDPATGADVRHYGYGEVEIVNTNAQDALEIHGVGQIGTSDVEGHDAELMAGQSVHFPQQTIEPLYLDLIVIRLGAIPTQALALHLTCGVGDNTSTAVVALSCVGMR